MIEGQATHPLKDATFNRNPFSSFAHKTFIQMVGHNHPIVRRLYEVLNALSYTTHVKLFRIRLVIRGFSTFSRSESTFIYPLAGRKFINE